MVTQSLVWSSLPLFLLLINIGVTLFQPTYFTKYLPFLALIGIGATLRFKRVGLAGSYLLFSFFLLFFTPHDEKLWSVGIFFSHALTLLVFLLTLEETQGCFTQLEMQLAEKNSDACRLENHLSSVIKTFEEKEKELIDELQKLKEEAEQRKIERIVASRHIELIQSEIELLTAQKESFVTDARVARKKFTESLQELEILKEKDVQREAQIEQQRFEIESLSVQNKILIEESDKAKQKIVDLLLEPQSKPSDCLGTDDKALQHSLAQAKGLYNQLRLQFEEKSLLLSKTRQELFRLEGKLMAHHKEEAWNQIENNRETALLLSEKMGELLHETASNEELIDHLEELISHILSQ